LLSKKKAARQQRREERAQKASGPETAEIIEVPAAGMGVVELAQLLAVPPEELLGQLFSKGVMASLTQGLDKATVELVAEEFDVVVVDQEEGAAPGAETSEADEERELAKVEGAVSRPPVVAVLGHVDHGKTSLLDYIRKATVASGEAGGITQAIGAYEAKVQGGSGDKASITFLDTPGHEAFTSMRLRGAQGADIAVLIVAADDGVKPQTIEAIKHVETAGVPVVVAINKMDKPGAEPQRVMQELSEKGLLCEDWGGQTPMVQLSAKSGDGIQELLDTILLLAEVEEFAANPELPAEGAVLEAHLERSRGVVASLLVQSGTLRVGDCVAAGPTFGRVRSMEDAGKRRKEEAAPSGAVRIYGLGSVPAAGDVFTVYGTEQEARKAAEATALLLNEQRLADNAQALAGVAAAMPSLSSMSVDGDETQGGPVILNLIVKGDSSGSVEALRQCLEALPQGKVALRFLIAEAGEISASDLDMAYAADGLVVSFNASPSEAIMSSAKQQGIVIRSDNVIYRLMEDITEKMVSLLDPEEVREEVGVAEVKAVFGSGKGKVAGCYVSDGKLLKNSLVSVSRGGEVVYEGPLSSLRREKDKVDEVPMGMECGVGSDWSKWEAGDAITAYRVSEKAPTLE
jgi:translation initiation factor IF-2